MAEANAHTKNNSEEAVTTRGRKRCVRVCARTHSNKFGIKTDGTGADSRLTDAVRCGVAWCTLFVCMDKIECYVNLNAEPRNVNSDELLTEKQLGFVFAAIQCMWRALHG